MISIKWLGHSAFKVVIQGKTFLVDPWVRNPASSNKDLEGLNPDYVLVTHGHGDHLGDTIEILRRYPSAKAVAIFELASHIAKELGDTSRVIDGNIGGPIDLGEGFFAMLTTATHSSNYGSPTGVVFGKGEEVVYHAGDTGVTYDMQLV
ncbi:MAG: MBL fold metallo-hydrolase, partial [Desulfurococcales archaeon]|nr:MBL fold metallo-hydrolase [Desulfurococcales archaeon]